MNERALQSEIRDVRIFYVLVEIVIAWQYAFVLYSVPGLRTPLHLTAFTLLVAVHGALHWLSPHVLFREKLGPPYLAVQGLLAFGLVLYTRSFTTYFALFSALIGETVGFYQNRKRMAAAAVTAYTGLAVAGAFLVFRHGELGSTLLIFLATGLFVVVFSSLYGRQIDARQRAEALLRELQSAHEKLAEYSARVEELTLAGERQRMARELHDTLAQGLTGLVLQLEAVDSFLEEGKVGRAASVVKNAMTSARSVLRESRDAIDALRSASSHAGTLQGTIETEAGRLTARGIRCSLSIDPPVSLEDRTTACIAGVVKEAFSNILRHSKASAVSLSLRTDGKRLRLEIRDDGEGFRPDGETVPGHYGLLGMKERVSLEGGTLGIESAPGCGTAISVGLPLPGGSAK